MHTKLLTTFFITVIFSVKAQSVNPLGKIVTDRSDFVNQQGKKSTFSGVNPTGERNSLPPCTILTKTHVSGEVAPINVTITYNLSYSTVTGSAKCWLMQNLGATTSPTSAFDASPEASGWYWQWGRKKGYQVIGTTRTPVGAWNNDPFSPVNVDWPAANDPCTAELGSGWRLPTYNEWRAFAIANPTTTQAYTSDLKIHNAGYLLQTTGALLERGSTAHYWSSDNGNIAGQGWAFSIPTAGGNTTISNNDKEAGFPLRCIRD